MRVIQRERERALFYCYFSLKVAVCNALPNLSENYDKIDKQSSSFLSVEDRFEKPENAQLILSIFALNLVPIM